MKFASWLLGICLLAVSPSGDPIGQARILFAEGKHEAALQAYKRALTNFPDQFAELHYNLGQCYLALDSVSAARSAFFTATRSQDAVLQAKSYNQLGVLLTQEANLPDAIARFREALAADPTNLKAAYNMELAQYLLAQQAATPLQAQKSDEESQEAEKNEPPNQSAGEGDTPPDPSGEDSQSASGTLQSENQNSAEVGREPNQASEAPIDVEQARKLLDAMRAQEETYAQELKKRPKGSPRDSGKPNW